MIEGYIFDYGGTIDTAGCHWGIKIWHTYQQLKLPITEQQYRKAYVYAEQTLGKTPIIQPNFTFRRTLEEKIKLQFQYLQRQGIIAETGFAFAKNYTNIVEKISTRTGKQLLWKHISSVTRIQLRRNLQQNNRKRSGKNTQTQSTHLSTGHRCTTIACTKCSSCRR